MSDYKRNSRRKRNAIRKRKKPMAHKKKGMSRTVARRDTKSAKRPHANAR